MPLSNFGYWDGGLTCIDYQSVDVGTLTEIELPRIPQGAKTALIVLEKDPTFTPDPNDVILARFMETLNSVPTALNGMPLTNLSIYRVTEANLFTFRIIAAQGGIHTLKVQYYG